MNIVSHARRTFAGSLWLAYGSPLSRGSTAAAAAGIPPASYQPLVQVLRGKRDWTDKSPGDFPHNRHGFQETYHCKGLLPRLRNDTKPLRTVPLQYRDSATADFFHPFRSKRLANKGQNDYIDILGDGSIHPVRTHTTVPPWLRGFKGNEYQQLVRKRWAYRNWKFEHPDKWWNMNRWMQKLYIKLNYHTKPPPPEY